MHVKIVKEEIMSRKGGDMGRVGGKSKGDVDAMFMYEVLKNVKSLLKVLLTVFIIIIKM